MRPCADSVNSDCSERSNEIYDLQVSCPLHRETSSHSKKHLLSSGIFLFSFSFGEILIIFQHFRLGSTVQVWVTANRKLEENSILHPHDCDQWGGLWFAILKEMHSLCKYRVLVISFLQGMIMQ